MKNNGFSLVDLLTTIMISGVLIGSAVPSLFSTYERSKSITNITTVLNAIQSARSYAVSHNTKVFVCGSASGKECDKVWNNRIIAFLDSDQSLTLSDNDTVLFVRQITTQKGYFYSRIASGMKLTRFDALGAAKYAGSFIYCPSDTHTKHAHRATWNRVGRSYKGRDKNGDGFIDDTSGSRISCHY